MDPYEQLKLDARRKHEELYADAINAENKRLEEMRQAEIARARRVEDAAARGETLNELPIDPEALRAVTLTSNPGMVKTPDKAPDPSQVESPLKRETL